MRSVITASALLCSLLPAFSQTAILDADQVSGSLIGMDYEPWFTPHNASWNKAEAIPVLGKYSSYDVPVLRQHEEWFESLGIDWLLVDWSNMLWLKPPWESQIGAVHELEETTELLFKTYSELAREGHHPPKIVLLISTQNGPPVPHEFERIRGVFDWIDSHYLANPDYKDLWLYYHGKPLIVVWYSPYNACEQLPKILRKTPVDDPHWTIRWMNQQEQVSHADACDMWSWVDGTIRQKVVYLNGKAEETVVRPSCFPPEGWLDPKAVGRDHGYPYLESWEVAFESRPKFVQISQWNEFVGQTEGKGYGPKHHRYLDQYNLNFSDDIEPTKMDTCAYRGCGGWGYYYMNMTKALISLYKGETPDITVMALSGSSNASKDRLPLHWISIGPEPRSYSLAIDGKTVATGIHGASYDLNLSQLTAGKHKLTLTAQGVHTLFDLDANHPAEKSGDPLPVTSSIEFTRQ